MILITTAGKVGAEAARLLAQRGEPVRVLVRDPEKATALAQAGADVAVGDLDVPATIDAAMRGISAVVLVSPAIPAQELNVVASAAGAGAGHVVKITSKASADSPIARRRDQTEIENGLIGSVALADRCAWQSALTRMTGCQMTIVSWSNAARIRWRAGTSVASS